MESLKKLLLGFRWRNVSITKGPTRMLAMVKEKGMNNGRPKKQLNITFLIPKFSIFIYNKRVIVVKIFPGIISTKYIMGSTTRECLLS